MAGFSLCSAVCRIKGFPPEAAAGVRGCGLRQPAGQQHPHGRLVGALAGGCRAADPGLQAYASDGRK